MKLTFLLLISTLATLSLASTIHYHFENIRSEPQEKHLSIQKKHLAHPFWLLCGADSRCVTCRNAYCANQSHSGIDRDKDKWDLKRCPYGYSFNKYIKYKQFWPAADVYSKVCYKWMKA